MSHTLSERTIAFAGICQAASLVQAVAKNGECDEAAFKASIRSITQTDPDSTLAVFGQLADLKIGLEAIITGINTNGNQDLTKYVISILALERKLNANSSAMNSLGDRIDTLNRQLEHYDLMDEQMLSNVASVYLDVVSPIGPRIQVAGSQTVLQQPTNQHKVRALLLAGIRSAVLWRQVGGKRRQLVLSRKAMVNEATNLLERI